MARTAKIDNAWKKRFDREEKKRAVETRDERIYFLIVCEGEKTEPNYFKAFAKELPIGTVDVKIEGTGFNTIGLINYAIKQRENTSRYYDRVWVVFDKDDFSENNFNSAITKAVSNNINCAWSNEAFELWFLLHFQYVNVSMKRSDYKGYLEKEIKDKSGNKDYTYKKNDESTYSVLQKFGDRKLAESYADKLISLYTDEKHSTHNPCTHVHKLIKELLNPVGLLKGTI